MNNTLAQSLTIAQLVERRDLALKMQHRNQTMAGGDPADAFLHHLVAKQYQRWLDERLPKQP